MKHLIPRPQTKVGRTFLGGALVAGGMVGFLPIVGFWMIPLGLIVLSEDFATVRKLRRKATVKIGRRWRLFRGT